MIRLGIVGSNYGSHVLLPAFRADNRCQVAAIAGSDRAKAADIARQSGIPRAFAHWSELVDFDGIDAVAIATPPKLQPEIAVRAIKNGKAVFLEKPLAADIAGAAAMLKASGSSKRPTIVDFEFAELETWRRARSLMREQATGMLRHVVVTWNTESYATRMRLKSWKTSGVQGGGALGNLVSHCFYYLEDFCGPVVALSGRLFGMPNEPEATESTVALSGQFKSGAGLSLVVSAASYLGSGHRIEFYGEDGTLVLANPTADYMRGFELHFGRRPAAGLERIAVDPPDAYPDGRIAPVARLAGRFIDAIENGEPADPSIHAGYRVQQLLDAARRAHVGGRWIDVAPERVTAELGL